VKLDRIPLGEDTAVLVVSIPVPRKTRSGRVVVETEEGGRIGGADLDRKAIDAAGEGKYLKAIRPKLALLRRLKTERLVTCLRTFGYQ
jgi:hypothetical protein